VGTTDRSTLAEFARFLPRIGELGLSQSDLAAIPVHAEPSSDDAFVTLGELPPGAPSLLEDRFPVVGTRQLYAFQAEVPKTLWQRLVRGLAPNQSSGTGGTGMFGTDDERFVEEENPQLAWERLDAGHAPYGS
jgi:hypothetical protein